MHEPPRFGTDGLRGEAGQPPLDAATLRRVGAALGVVLQSSGGDPKRVLFGDDGRASAGWIRSALAQGLSAADASSVDAGLITTPALAHLTRTEGFVAGVMISASHNPARDNGIKIFDAQGRKLADELEREIERLTGEVDFEVGREPRVRPVRDLIGHYEEFLANTFPDLDLSGHTIAVDAAHGGGSELAPVVLRRFGAETVTVGCAPDGNNINAGVGALHPENLVDTVRRSGAVLGVCLDGDGDRGVFIDDRGEVRDGDAVMAVLAKRMHAEGRLQDATLVATVMSNLGLHKCLADAGIRVHTTPVGDRAVVQAMREHGYALGGEQSGHIIFAEEGDYTGDGLFTALKLLSIPGFLESSSRVFDDFHRYPQLLHNVAVSSKPPLESLDAVQAAVAAVERELGDDGRVVLRYSGTENLCRVMVECADEDAVRRHVDRIVAAVTASLG